MSPTRLPSRKKQRALTAFQIALNARPARGADSQSGAGNHLGYLIVLKRVELFELFEAKGENVVVERAGRAAK